MNKFQTFHDEKIGEKYYYHKHESGLDVYVFPKKLTVKTALLGVKFGSIYECGALCDGEKKSYPYGIAHFLEHKLFSSEDGVDAIETLASYGADGNAYTSNNKTVYMFSCTENFSDALRGLINFVYHPYFTKENVNSERGIITQEIKMCLDSPYDTVSQNLLVAMYGDENISHDVLGTAKTIKKITPEVLFDCYESFYRYSNMALVVSGDLDEAEVLKIVDETLPKREWTSAPVLPSMNYPDRVQKSKIEKRMPVSQPIFEIGIKDTVPSENAYERLKRDAEMTILGEMLFSRAGDFYNDIFENGIINESYSYGYSITRDVAFHSIYAESEYPMLVLEKLKEHIAGARAKGLSQRDFVRCKRVLLAEFIRDFESVDDIANSVMNFVFEGANIFEYRKIIEGVTYEDVCRVFDGTFAPDTFAISIVKK